MTRTIGILLLLALAVVLGPAVTLAQTCTGQEIPMKVWHFEKAGFQLDLPDAWQPEVIEGKERVVIKDETSRCRLQMSSTQTPLSLEHVVRLNERLYFGSNQIRSECRDQLGKQITWTEELALGQYPQRFSTLVSQVLYARIGARTVIGALRCPTPEGQPVDWSLAGRVFSSYRCDAPPPLPASLGETIQRLLQGLLVQPTPS